ALGTLPAGALEKPRVDTNRTLAEHMAGCGAKLETVREGKGSLDPKQIRVFLEIHIEQAPSLVAANVPVGVCTGIPGNFRYPNVVVRGARNHVGLPKRFRQDAVVAASELVCRLDGLWEELEALGRPMACTFGRF